MYVLPKLPYVYDALEPYIDTATMTIHHTKHHQGYVDNLNKALDKHVEWHQKSLEELLHDLKSVPEDIRTAVQNNGGGHWNHSFFWEIMAPAKGDSSTGSEPSNSEPARDLKKAIEAAFNSFVKFKEQFANAGLTRFGSGWAWLAVGKDKKLKIYSTPNQDNPLMQGDQAILGVDVWEHAYYLKYQNRRADYLAAFWNVVNWKRVEEHFARIS